MQKPKTKKKYIGINAPKKWKPYFDELLAKPEIMKKLELRHFRETDSGLGCLIIHEFLVDNTTFHYEHYNTLEDHIVIIDNKIGRMIFIYVKTLPDSQFQLYCEHCGSINCEHVKAVVEIHRKIIEGMEKKGWTYKGE